ncbi:MAG TPA: NAD(+) diphosphatase [Candidatus Dormibacteraeota bacterium]
MSAFEPGVDHAARPAPEALVFAFAGDRLAVSIEGERAEIPTARAFVGDTAIFFGRLDGRDCFALALDPGEEPSGLRLSGLRELFGRLDPAVHNVAGRAFQVTEWFRGHAFCGRCGTPTELAEGERARACPRCGALYFPRINPAVIFLVERGDRMLLARSRNFRGPFYSVLAGFVEPGESLEETIEREVREEVGLEVGDIRYFGSQPWPFPSQLMIGFNIQHARGEIQLQDSEIVDAGWFGTDGLPELPGRFSIARRLIEDFLARHRR